MLSSPWPTPWSTMHLLYAASVCVCLHDFVNTVCVRRLLLGYKDISTTFRNKMWDVEWGQKAAVLHTRGAVTLLVQGVETYTFPSS